jgi:hypothetical protein
MKGQASRVFVSADSERREMRDYTHPDDVNKYFNRRAECWGLMRDWLQAGADIPDDRRLMST